MTKVTWYAVHPTYPECLYGSKRYTVTYKIAFEDADGSIVEETLEKKFENQTQAEMFGKVLANS